jgi:hypothetical protein
MGNSRNDTRPSVVVLPSVENYSGPFQQKLLLELENIEHGIACDSDLIDLYTPCSAIWRMMLDYKDLRGKIRN